MTRHRGNRRSSRDDPEAEPRAGRRSRRRRPAMTAEERALRAARRRVNARLGFFSHLTTWGAVCMMLLFVAGVRVAFIVALCWGVGIAMHYFLGVIAPDLRRRLLEREVGRQVAVDAPRERRNVSDKHVRSLEELSAEVAHEIRNPITAAKSLVQQMGEDPASRENVGYARVALEELDRVERSVAHLLRYAREEDLRMNEVRLAEVVESALDTVSERAKSQGVALTRDIDTEAVLHGDAEKLRRVVINLANNALDALDESAPVQPCLEVMAGENLAGTECWVRVRDNGPGVDPDSLSKIFSPFYTSKASGTGLGLALSKKVVDAHGGSIEASSQPGAGTEFTITIPKQVGA